MAKEENPTGDDTGIRINHYRAEGAGGEKGLITEMVLSDSISFKFLGRMEEKRLTKACQLNIDMRERVDTECKRYRYQGRLFYLDDKSLKIYKTMMKESSGVFTVGIYEAVINAEHTLKAQKRAKQDAKLKRQQKQQTTASGQKPAVIGAMKSKKDREVTYTPDRITLGHYFKRQESRLKYATKIQIRTDLGSVTANTKDLSPGGMFVVIPEVFEIEENANVSVQFTRLKEESTHVSLNEVPFKVLGVEEKNEKMYLKMVLQDDYDDVQEYKLFMKSIIKKYSARNKYCADDDCDTQVAVLLEKMYCDNMSQIPIYLATSKKGKPYVQLFGRSLGNAYLMHHFRREEGFDMSPFTLSHRIKSIVSEPELTIAMYRAGDSTAFKLNSLASNECETPEQWSQFIRFTLSQPEYCVVKLVGVTEVLPDPETRKLKSVYTQFGEKSPEDLQRMLSRMQELNAFGLVVDVTTQIEDEYGQKIFDTAVPKEDELSYWFGRKYIVNGSTKENSDKLVRPHFTELAYRECRGEMRFIIEISVELQLPEQKITGQTRDLSVFGLCVVVPEVIYDIDVGEDLLVGLVSLQKKRTNLNLTTVPYRLMKVITDEKKQTTTFMLFRVPETRDEGVTKFFQELIETNQHKLSVCTNDLHSEVLSRTYESMCGENTQTMPLFLAKDTHTGSIIMNLFGVPDKVGELADFFQTSKQIFDLSCLNRTSVTAMIYQQTVQISRAAEGEENRPQPCEMVYYVSKDYDDALDKVVFNAKAECEFASMPEKQAYLQGIRDSGHAFKWVKLSATFAQALRPNEIDEAVELVRKNDKTKSFQLRELIFNVLAIAELTDITDIIESAS
ncbi:MAG: PilZ domain-containing protein [Methylococcales bacterium]|jgi:hypothetical protein|nr:PilZ domain-containing protein [Methylococcales bacterium]MBT7444982.1 PilZ domain-containing protein [Methylococcales bacterium]